MQNYKCFYGFAISFVLVGLQQLIFSGFHNFRLEVSTIILKENKFS